MIRSRCEVKMSDAVTTRTRADIIAISSVPE